MGSEFSGPKELSGCKLDRFPKPGPRAVELFEPAVDRFRGRVGRTWPIEAHEDVPCTAFSVRPSVMISVSRAETPTLIAPDRCPNKLFASGAVGIAAAGGSRAPRPQGQFATASAGSLAVMSGMIMNSGMPGAMKDQRCHPAPLGQRKEVGRDTV